MKHGQPGICFHQWVASSHPDPECMQMRVLQDALNNMMGKLKSIPVDSVYEAQNSNVKPLPTSKIMSEPLFFWLSEFLVPGKTQ